MDMRGSRLLRGGFDGTYERRVTHQTPRGHVDTTRDRLLGLPLRLRTCDLARMICRPREGTPPIRLRLAVDAECARTLLRPLNAHLIQALTGGNTAREQPSTSAAQRSYSWAEGALVPNPRPDDLTRPRPNTCSATAARPKFCSKTDAGERQFQMNRADGRRPTLTVRFGRSCNRAAATRPRVNTDRSRQRMGVSIRNEPTSAVLNQIRVRTIGTPARSTSSAPALNPVPARVRLSRRRLLRYHDQVPRGWSDKLRLVCIALRQATAIAFTAPNSFRGDAGNDAVLRMASAHLNRCPRKILRYGPRGSDLDKQDEPRSSSPPNARSSHE